MFNLRYFNKRWIIKVKFKPCVEEIYIYMYHEVTHVYATYLNVTAVIISIGLTFTNKTNNVQRFSKSQILVDRIFVHSYTSDQAAELHKLVPLALIK